MAKEKYNHGEADFMTALQLDKDELFDIAIKGFDKHFTKGVPLSKCILEMVESMKSNSEKELKIFAAGIIFSQLLSMTKDDDDVMGSTDLHKSRKVITTTQKIMPFDAKDLLKSIRDEMETKTDNDTKSTDSN